MANILYTEEMLTNKDVMRRFLFIETVKNPKYCCHYTGMPMLYLLNLKAQKLDYNFTGHDQLFDIYFVGLDVAVLKALFELIENKATRISTWKGSRGTKSTSLDERYSTVVNNLTY